MSVLPEELIARLQDVVDRPRTECEKFISNLLNNLPPDEFQEVVNERLADVTPAVVREFGTQMFNRMDRRPNPPDGLVTMDEIADALLKETESRQHEAILLYIWLHFDKIKQSSEDFQGIEKAFDYVLTRKDFEHFVG